MKTKLTKLWSFLLSLVMLLSLLPTTVLAASPDASNVYVDGGKSFYNNRLYYKKGDQDKNFTGNEGDYIAHYNPATGTLTLNGYSGGSISVGGVKCSDITVVLKGTNTINGSLENAVGGDITVTSSDGGTLSISKTTSGSNSAIGIETGLSASYTTGNVTIKGNAKVTINMTHNGTSTYEKAYGIFAKENITISENASVDITCATPNNTTGGGNCNGLYAAKDVTIDTNGTIKIDVTNAGKDKDNGYSYGVYHMRTATLTKVGNMEVQWKKEDNNTNYPGGAFTKGATFSDTDHAINVDTTNCYASYRCGSPYTVTVQNGTVTGPGVPNASGSGMFLENDTVNITPYERKGKSGETIPFKGWTSSNVTLTSPTTASNSFTVANKDVTVTATYNPFDGTPVFTRTSDSSGTIAFQTAVKPDGGTEYFQYVEVGKETDPYGYQSIAPQPTTTSGASPYKYSVSASTYYVGDIKYLEAGDYRMAVTLNGERYLSDPFTVNYTAPVTTYTVSFNANGGTGTMADVTDISGEYTLPANGFTAPAGKQFKAWSVGGVEKDAGDKITVTANTTVTAVWEDIPVVTYTVSFDANGGTGTMTDVTGVSGEYTLPANGFTAPDGKQFKAWSVGGVEKAAGDKITVTANTTVTAVWEAVEYNVTVTGGTASVGAGTPITKATMGTTVTLTAGAAPSGQMFDKWVVENGDITLADATSATTTFTMLAGEVSVKATYKDAPHTHTFDQKTIKDAALKTAADCTHDAVYYKSCSCGEISTNDADAFTATDSALGHSYKNGVCTRCGEKDPNYIAAPVIKITTSAGKPKISWSKVEGAVKYKVYRSTDGKKYGLLATTTGTSITNTKAKIGTTYYYKVKAVNASGAMSEFSNDVNIKCRPAAPVVSISRSNGKPKLTWKAVTGASKYYIYRSTDGKTFKYYEKTTKTSFTDSKAASGKKYYYKVKAVTVVNGKAIVSGYSNVKSIFTSLAKPTVKITTASGKPKLTWGKVTGADKYYVYRSTDGKTFKHFATTTKLSYTNTSAKKGTKYYYKVKAVYTANTNANSAFSAVVSIKATK